MGRQRRFCLSILGYNGQEWYPAIRTGTFGWQDILVFDPIMDYNEYGLSDKKLE